MSRHLYVVLMAAVLLSADAQAQSSPWSVSFDLGAQVQVSGDVHGAGSGQVLGLPTEVESRSYDDVYGSGFGWAAGVGYRLGETARGGFVRLEEVKSEFSVPAAGVALSEVNFYGSSVVPSFAAGGGMQISLSDMVALQGGGIEFKWQGDAEGNDGLAGTGLESINDESRRWSLPVTGGITFRF